MRTGLRLGALVGPLVVSCFLFAGCKSAPIEPLPAEKKAAPSPKKAGAPDGKPAAKPAAPTAAGLPYITWQNGSNAPKVPLVIAMHGLGSKPESFAGLFRKMHFQGRIVVPRAIDPWHGGFSWFPIRAASKDVAKLSVGVSKAADRVLKAIEELKQRYSVYDKVIVTGFSQGGMLSFALSVRKDAPIATALPLAGWLPEPMWPKAAPAGGFATEVIAFHGDADTRLPYGETKRGVEHLRKLGLKLDFKTYPGVGHSISRQEAADIDAALSSATNRLIKNNSPKKP